jgi:aldehyde dehydrogenase (NAD+)
MGSPISWSTMAQAFAPTMILDYYAGLARTYPFEELRQGVIGQTLVRREPVGVVAAIVPWNFPLLLTAWKVAPALACGNTVIIKPATQTPLTALALADVAQEVGIPPGVINVITGRGSEIGEYLVTHAGIDKVAFTGDTATGRTVMRNAAGTVKHTTLELGGKSPNIVFADADLDAAVRGATTGIFYGKGEVCAAGSRLLVESRIKDDFVARVAERARKMRPGDPLDPKTRLGALVSGVQMERVLRYVEVGKSEGATLVAGGKRYDIGTGKGFFMEPTVFADVAPRMTIAREEIFGPVLAVIEFSDVDDAVSKANDCDYGLAAGVWTQDIKKAHNVAARLQAGTVWVNAYNVYDTAAPFGGYKQSGYGREMGMHALTHYTQTKTVWIDLSS